jgi:hypothetical protein
MNIQFYINDKEAEYDDKLEISLTKEFQDPAELVAREITYSYTLQIPTTLHNKTILGFIDNADVTSKFGKVYRSQLYVNESLIIDGNFVIQEVDSEYYSGNLYIPSQKELKDVLGDRNLNEIIPHNKYLNTLEDIAAINNYVAGFDGDLPPEEQRDRHICYPYVLYNLPYNTVKTSEDKYTQSLGKGEHTFDISNVYPAFNVCSVLKDMFLTEGYNLTGNIFSDVKFTDLYHSYSGGKDDYNNALITPYYLSFDLSYFNALLNSSHTMTNTSTMDNGFRFGYDSIFQSKYFIRYNIINEYSIMKTSDDGNPLIRVPKSGWYKIKCEGSLYVNNSSDVNGWDGGPRTIKMKSNNDLTDFSRNVMELHITRGNPKSNPNFMGLNGVLPTEAVVYEDNVVYNKDGWLGLNVGETQKKFAKNNYPVFIKNTSAMPTNDFIAGVKFGCPYNFPGIDDDRWPTRNNKQIITAALPNPQKNGKLIDNKYLAIFKLTEGNSTAGNGERYDFGVETSQILVREDSYTNFPGWNIYDVSTQTWDTTTDPGKLEWAGLKWSNARLAELSNDKCKGEFLINTCVWLDEGDTLNFEMLMPYHDFRTKCGWAETCKWKDRSKSGITRSYAAFNFSMGLITTDKSWSPTEANPVPDDSTISAKKINQR